MDAVRQGRSDDRSNALPTYDVGDDVAPMWFDCWSHVTAGSAVISAVLDLGWVSYPGNEGWRWVHVVGVAAPAGAGPHVAPIRQICAHRRLLERRNGRLHT